MAVTDPILDIADVAALLGVPEQTVRTWRWRDETKPLADGTLRLPRPHYIKSGVPIWDRAQFIIEAKAMGRL